MLPGMTVFPDWYEPTLDLQLRMNEQTWEKLGEHGVTEATELRLDFFFDAPGEDEAHTLADHLRTTTDYDVEVDSADGAWTVAGATQPTPVTLDVLNDWVAWMVAAGARHGPCKFDGWGAQTR